MRRILNLFITGLILWAGSQLFPGTVQIDGIGTLILATLLLWVTEIIVAVIGVVMAAVGAVCESLTWVFIGLLIGFGSTILALYILSNVLPGFSISGFWPKVIFALCSSLLYLKAPSSDSQNSYY